MTLGDVLRAIQADRDADNCQCQCYKECADLADKQNDRLAVLVAELDKSAQVHATSADAFHNGMASAAHTAARKIEAILRGDPQV